MQPPTAAWPSLRGLPVHPLEGGLINASFSVGDPPVAAVQRLNTAIFSPLVHEDIEAVTAWVQARGMPTPRLLRTEAGALWLEDESGCWRALSWVEGVSHHKLKDPALAREAGRLVGRWHRATEGLRWDFRSPRAGKTHLTTQHMATLEAALREHRGHRLFAQVEPLAQGILAAWASWDGSLGLPARVTHGDLKISNLRFSASGQGICLLDLDTMGPMAIDLEMGDAWRSWCNPAAEDVVDASFDLDLFAASAAGWLGEYPVDAATREALPGGIERICVELSARFCADALNESYFGWNPKVAPTRGEHNLLRARGQFSLARSVRAQRAAIARVLS